MRWWIDCRKLNESVWRAYMWFDTEEQAKRRVKIDLVMDLEEDGEGIWVYQIRRVSL